MHTNWNLRPELASVCRFLAASRSGRPGTARPPRADLPPSGVLGDLARRRGL